MTSYLRHIAQHTDLSKGKCEIQISQTEIVWSSWDEESPLISTVLHWGNIFGTSSFKRWQTVADSATLLSGHFSGIASHLKKINPHMISLHHKLTPKFYSCSHQKLAMVGLCWMTSYVARYNTSGSIFTASVQGDQFLLLGFTATVSTFQFNEVIIRKIVTWD